jgi:murein DD-endopeptidase MepM/ murein hydrolase activator NlpD
MNYLRLNLSRTFLNVGAIVIAVLLLSASLAFAEDATSTSATSDTETPEDILLKINEQNEKIAELDEEIAQYEDQLDEVGKEKQTLQSAVRTLDISRSKMTTQISATENRINVLELELIDLDNDITVHQDAIDRNEAALAQTLRSLDAVETTGMFEAILSTGSISAFWDDLVQTSDIQNTLGGRIQEIVAAKASLEESKQESEEKHGQLSGQKSNLSAQKRSLDITRSSKNNLLAQTKNQESEYQKILAEKRKARIEFENALNEYQAQLSYDLSPEQVPPAGKGVLRWPLDSVRITQYFGNTEFAKSGAYNGKGHNGIDLAASIGTPLHAALTGTIQATGNTDEYKGCYSYGKWILLRHPNGISTLYAHLSEIAVSKGDSIRTGEVIGYTGNTGYTTGPHLHLTVFASEAVQVVRMGDVKKITNCGGAYVPVAPLQAYLNPLDYL